MVIMDYTGGLVANGGMLGRDVGFGKGGVHMSRSKKKYNNVNGGGLGMLMSGNYDARNGGMYNEGGFTLRMGKPMTKKRSKRLDVEQVKALERAFKESNRLGLERKGSLARELNLQARQIAVWFQNRRARCKTKQIESQFDGLKHEMKALKAQRDELLQEKEKLEAQVSTLKHQLSSREDSSMSSPSIPQESEHLEYSSTMSIMEENDIAWNLPVTWNNGSSFINAAMLCTTTSSNFTREDPIILDTDFLFYHQNNLIYAS